MLFWTHPGCWHNRPEDFTVVGRWTESVLGNGLIQDLLSSTSPPTAFDTGRVNCRLSNTNRGRGLNFYITLTSAFLQFGLINWFFFLITADSHTASELFNWICGKMWFQWWKIAWMETLVLWFWGISRKGFTSSEILWQNTENFPVKQTFSYRRS